MAKGMPDCYVAILRGINLGTKNMIKMPALVKVFEQAGFEEVRTYLQSGNVVFKSAKKEIAVLQREIHHIINKELGLDIPVIVLSKDYLTKVRDNNPFVNKKEIDLTKLHVTFLAEEPAQENLEKIDAEKFLPDEFKLEDRTLYLHCPVDYGHTKLSNTFFEKKLKVIATTRNWKTVNALADLVCA